MNAPERARQDIMNFSGSPGPGLRQPPARSDAGPRLLRAAALCGCAVVTIGAVGLAGALSGRLILGSLSRAYVPMAASTALLFLILGCLLALGPARPRRTRPGQALALAAICLTVGVGLSEFLEMFLAAEIIPLDSLTRRLQDALSIPRTPMSPATGAIFALAGAALWLFAFRPDQGPAAARRRDLAGGLGSLVAVAGLTLLLGYLYGTPLLYGSRVVPVALTTSLAFLLAGVGIACAAGPQGLPLRPLFGNSIRARLLRAFLPIVVLLTLSHPVLDNLYRRFLDINDAFLAGIWAMVFAGLTAGLVMQVGRTIGASLDRAEALRTETERNLVRLNEEIFDLYNNAPCGYHSLDQDGVFVRINDTELEWLGYERSEVVGKLRFPDLLTPEGMKIFRKNFPEFKKKGQFSNIEIELVRKDGSTFFVNVSATAVKDEQGRFKYSRTTLFDITGRKHLESQLLQAQKLESIGLLAAGIAHEINTPTQYVGDNTRFLDSSFEELIRFLDRLKELLATAAPGMTAREQSQRIEQEMLGFDIDYLKNEIPQAIGQTLEGIERISTIVQSVKRFAHPTTETKAPADLNEAIRNTLTVSRNEWKYVAEMRTDFDETLPAVPCAVDEINQVVLNLIINAAQAIADVLGKRPESLGTISVSTRRHGPWAEIRVQDTGAGIPQEIQSRVFDPFFTTKEVGKGTGQGLAIARTVVVEKHEGEISFESEMGKGATFLVRLPLEERA